MNIKELFESPEKLDAQILYFLKKKQIEKISANNSLIKAHLDKVNHNMEFFSKNKEDSKYLDWLIVILYYALYHCALALTVNKKYLSKNHSATICLLIKEYSISQSDAELLEELSISKEDAKLYTDLKSDRHNASYSTNMDFDYEKVLSYREKVIEFIAKTYELLKK